MTPTELLDSYDLNIDCARSLFDLGIDAEREYEWTDSVRLALSEDESPTRSKRQTILAVALDRADNSHTGGLGVVCHSPRTWIADQAFVTVSGVVRADEWLARAGFVEMIDRRGELGAWRVRLIFPDEQNEQ